jgi:hypothetical protein
MTNAGAPAQLPGPPRLTAPRALPAFQDERFSFVPEQFRSDLAKLSGPTRDALFANYEQSELKVLAVNPSKDFVIAKFDQGGRWSNEHIGISTVNNRVLETRAEQRGKYSSRWDVQFTVDTKLTRPFSRSNTPGQSESYTATRAALSRVKSMFVEHTKHMPEDAILVASPVLADGGGRGREAIYRRLGFTDAPGYELGGIGELEALASTFAKKAAQRRDAAGRPCGKSHISSNKTCRQRGAFPTGKAIAAGLTAGAVGAVLLNKTSRRAILGAPAAARRLTQTAITEGVHRATAPKPSMKLTGAALNAMRPPSKTQRLHTAAQQANRTAERAISAAAQAELERGAAVGRAMYAAGKATRASLRSGLRTHNLTVEKLRRRYEPGYRKPRSDNYIQHYAPVQLQPPTRRDAEDGKKYTKVVTNPETGRKNRIRYGAKGYKIAPGTPKGDRYCARSFGDMKSHGKDCSGPDRNTPLCLSRTKWRCSGKVSRRDGALTPGKS